jgi:hypothetical protein
VAKKLSVQLEDLEAGKLDAGPDEGASDRVVFHRTQARGREPGKGARTAAKRAILHRKNSLFYRNERGSAVGDLYMSLIETCRLCGADPFEYLTILQKHSRQVAERPEEWLPWNYRLRLAAADTS